MSKSRIINPLASYNDLELEEVKVLLRWGTMFILVILAFSSVVALFFYNRSAPFREYDELAGIVDSERVEMQIDELPKEFQSLIDSVDRQQYCLRAVRPEQKFWVSGSDEAIFLRRNLTLYPLGRTKRYVESYTKLLWIEMRRGELGLVKESDYISVGSTGNNKVTFMNPALSVSYKPFEESKTERFAIIYDPYKSPEHVADITCAEVLNNNYYKNFRHQ